MFIDRGRVGAPASTGSTASTSTAAPRLPPGSGPRGNTLAADPAPAAGNAIPVPEAISASATFADATVSGNAGCNDYTGSYTVDGEKLTIGPLAATKKACGPAESPPSKRRSWRSWGMS